MAEDASPDPPFMQEEFLLYFILGVKCLGWASSPSMAGPGYRCSTWGNRAGEELCPLNATQLLTVELEVGLSGSSAGDE